MIKLGNKAPPLTGTGHVQARRASVSDYLDAVTVGRTNTERPEGNRVLIGLVGRGIQQSRTPLMHEREGARLGLCCKYVLIDLDAAALPDDTLAAILDEAESRRFSGLNVTHPFKQAVMPLLGDIAPEAQAIGAVNTIVFRDGRRSGHNTDNWGFAESFRGGMAGASLDLVAQFGAGGAGAAVAHALLSLGVRDLVLFDPDHNRAKALAERMAARFNTPVAAGTDVAEVLSRCTGIVNATPVGMAKYPGTPFPAELLKASHWVAEIIYFPEETELLQRARQLGCRTLAGTGMAIGQAVRAFELFTGLRADKLAMAAHFTAAA